MSVEEARAYSDRLYPPTAGESAYENELHNKPLQKSNSPLGIISFSDVVAGVLIGAFNQSLAAVFITSFVWALTAWFCVVLIIKKSKYEPGTRLFFGSPAVTRFIVWWSTAFGTSLLFGLVVYGGRRFFA